MQNHQFDLQTGESVRLGDYRVTLLEIVGDGVVLEIEGPDGECRVLNGSESAEELAVPA
ncbi:MAG: hypothetical protein RIK87_10265 [Fuerstiella sp.]